MEGRLRAASSRHHLFIHLFVDIGLPPPQLQAGSYITSIMKCQ